MASFKRHYSTESSVLEQQDISVNNHDM